MPVSKVNTTNHRVPAKALEHISNQLDDYLLENVGMMKRERLRRLRWKADTKRRDAPTRRS